jgi:putative endonuclease
MKPKYRRMLRGMKAQEKQTSPAAAAEAVWSLYILKCCDGSLYTGVTIDVDRRLREHRQGTASRYTRTRRPLVLVYREECGSRSQALSRECAVKSLSRQLKDEIILTRSPQLSPAFQGGDKKRGSGFTPNKPRHSCRGVEGLTSPGGSVYKGFARQKEPGS